MKGLLPIRNNSEPVSVFMKYRTEDILTPDSNATQFDTPNTIPPTFQEDIFKILNTEHDRKKELEKLKTLNSSLSLKIDILKEKYRKRIDRMKRKHKIEIMRMKTANDRIRRDLKLQKSGTKFAQRQVDTYRSMSTESTPSSSPEKKRYGMSSTSSTPSKKRDCFCSTSSTPSSSLSGSLKDLVLGMRSNSVQCDRPGLKKECVCCYVSGDEGMCSNTTPSSSTASKENMSPSAYTLTCEKMMDQYTIEIQKAKIELLEDKIRYIEEKFARSQLEFIKNVGLIDFYL